MQNGRQVLQLLDASIDLQVNHLVSNVLATNVFGVKELESMYYASQAVLPSSMHACLTKTRCLQKRKKKKVHPAWPSPLGKFFDIDGF